MTTPAARAAAIALVSVLVLALRLQVTTARTQAPGEPCAPQHLADTGLYAPGGAGLVAESNRPFAPQYPLWSDGATKRRWVYLPAGSTIDVTKADGWEFPVGTRFWKEFSFHGRKVETRMLWKALPDRWIAASYHWNDAETDAVLAPEGGVPGVVEVAPGRSHRIPAVSDCAACHGSERFRPLGFNALQLSPDRDPQAIHGEPLAPGMLTLAALVSERLISPNRSDYTQPPRIATRRADTRAVLGYLSANCGSCHNGAGTITAPAPLLRERDLLSDGDAVAREWIGRATRWQLPDAAEGDTVLINPAAPDTSALLARMRSRRPSSQMPPLGTVVRDDAALEAIARWIASDPSGER